MVQKRILFYSTHPQIFGEKLEEGVLCMFHKAPGGRGEYKYIVMATIQIKGRICNRRQNEEGCQNKSTFWK